MTVVSTASQVFLEKRDTGGNSAQLDLLGPPERMVRGERTDRLDREVYPEIAVPGVFLAQEGLQVHQASVVSLGSTGNQVPKETWDHKANRDHLDSRVTQVHMVWWVLKVQSGRPEKKVLRVSRVLAASPAPTAPQVTQERKVLQERREQLVTLVPWAPSGTPGLAVSRELRASEVLKAAKERRERTGSLASRGTWV